MPQAYFPLRWESTGDQWWYASPIDWAAANGHYDLVRELLYLDTNLLIKLTSLRRIRRLETVWDDDSRFIDAAKGRSFVARNLLLECETKNRKNSLIQAGYGGWLLYTAASAGDVVFVEELLERDPLLVFGEGEYGVTDILYAAARSKNSVVFRLLFAHAVRPKCLVGGGGGEIEEEGASRARNLSVFRSEMVNRAVHAAARGGNLEMLNELLHDDCIDVLAYRDVQGSTILHSASGRGQVEVVKYLVSSFNIINSRDNQGNIALHIAACRGHLPVVESLIIASPTSSSTTNNAGDTFLHMAVAGFRTSGFRRLDRQMELMKNLINGRIMDIQEVINIRNNEGRTVLHVSVIGKMHSDVVELLITVPTIDLNIQDINGMTPLDLLAQGPRSASSVILIKKLLSVGGILSARDGITLASVASQPRMHRVGTSPGSSFKISDAEIFLYTGIEVSEVSGRPSSCSSSAKSEADFPSEKKQAQSSVNKATNKLKILLRWPRRKEKKKLEVEDGSSMESIKKWSERENTPTPLRQRFSKTSLMNNKRTLSVRNSMPSPASKKKFAAGLMHGVIQAMPHLAPPSARSRSDSYSKSGMSTPAKSEAYFKSGMSTPAKSEAYSKSGMSTPAKLEKQKEICLEEEEEIETASCSNSVVNVGGEFMEKFSHRRSFVNSKLMNQYFCFGAQGLAVEDSVSRHHAGRLFKRSSLSVA